MGSCPYEKKERKVSMSPSVDAAMMRGVVGALSVGTFEMTLDGCAARPVAAMRLPTVRRAVR